MLGPMPKTAYVAALTCVLNLEPCHESKLYCVLIQWVANQSVQPGRSQLNFAAALKLRLASLQLSV